MKKFFTWGIILLVGLFVLSGCGEDAATQEMKENDTEKAEAKTGDEATPASEDSKEAKGEGKQDDIWTYYEDATWADDFNGLKSEIQKVAVTNKAPTFDDPEAEKSAVGVKFKLENTTQEKFTTYPDQATLVTSTGEQVEADLYASESLGGEIDKGVIKEGTIIWYLERGKADKIEWIKMEWYAKAGDEMEDGERKEYEVEIQLQ